jgi:hypothetical protein
MSRWWTERVAVIGETVGLGLAALLLLLAAGLVGAAWYWYPASMPWRWLPRLVRRISKVRFRKPRWPWRRKPKVAKATEEVDTEQVAIGADELPDLPAEEFRSLADQYAAQGRYAEAVRERLRAIVRDLVDAGVVENRPGWTVTELARAASAARPPVRPPLDGASLLFSDIWYGLRPAYAEHDARMRSYAEQVHVALQPVPAGGVR